MEMKKCGHTWGDFKYHLPFVDIASIHNVVVYILMHFVWHFFFFYFLPFVFFVLEHNFLGSFFKKVVHEH